MKKAINQTTLNRLLLGFTAIMIGFTLTAFFMIVKSVDDAMLSYDNRFNLRNFASTFMSASDFLTDEVRGYAATGNQEHYDRYWNEINNDKNIEIGLDGLFEIGITDEENAILEEMLGINDILAPMEAEAMDLAGQGDTDAALAIVRGKEYEELAEKVKSLQQDFLDALNVRTDRELEAAMATKDFYSTLMVVAIIATAVVQVFNTLITKYRIVNPIAHIKDEMVEMSAGNLNSKFNMEPNTSEIGMLIHSIQQTKDTLKKYINDISTKLESLAGGDMSAELDMDYIGDFTSIHDSLEDIFTSFNKALGEVKSSSNEVNSASEQISQASQNLANGSTEQSSTIEHLSEEVDSVFEMAQMNSEIADTAMNLIQESYVLMDETTTYMDAMVASMGSIQSSSEDISHIIKVIEDIAFQTNILALNAAVEAARAGQYGKGFAVVADEVRNLAAKSAEAAKQTTQLIEASTQSVEEGSGIVRNVESSLKAVGDIAAKNGEQIAQMSSASQQQRDSLAEVTTAIKELREVVHNNSATAEETAAASQQMSAQANLLNSLISRFTLRDERSRSFQYPAQTEIEISEEDWNDEAAYSPSRAGRR